MDCPRTEWLGAREYLQRFNRKVIRERVPLSGSFALTHRCNLRCAHCYLGGAAGGCAGRAELTGAQAEAIIDQLVEAGCLYLVFTGGEPLLHPDFARIYTYARCCGMVITVFSNGTAVTDELAAVLARYPVHNVEVSVYGATAATCDAVTGVAGSFARCRAGLETLRRHGVRLILKTVIMRDTRDDLPALAALAAEFGAGFRFDPAIFPRFDGDTAPLEQRLPAAAAVAGEFADADRARRWRDYAARHGSYPPDDRVYVCGAGRTTFHVDPYGFLQPCLMMTEVRYDLLAGDFATGWREVMPRIRERRLPASSPCRTCDRRALCGYCPPFSRLETGSEGAPSPYLCALGLAREQRIMGERCER